MATITSLGVGSGLDLNGLLTQLQASERQKLAPLTQQQNAQQTKISAYGRLQSAMDRLQESMTALNDTSTFRQQTSKVTGEGVTATAGENASAGRYDISVTHLAKAGSVASDSVALDQVLTTESTTLTIDFGATYKEDGSYDSEAAPLSSYSLEIAADSTLEDVRDQINADSEVGVTASIVNDGTGYRLALSSKETGKEASVVGFSGLDELAQDDGTLRPGRDAELEVNGIAITGTTNRIEGAIEGVTLNISAVSENPVSLVIERDEASLKETIEKFVSTYNEVRSTIDRATAFNGEGGSSGDLLGDRTVRTIENRIRRDITDSLGSGDLNRLAQIGIDIDERGRLQIDETKLDDAIASDPEGLTSFFAGDTKEGGFAGRLQTTLDSITADDGILQVSVDSAERRIDNLDERKLRMERSIERNIERYRSQFAQLDGMIAQMNSMGSYLAQQFSMLNAMQNNN